MKKYLISRTYDGKTEWTDDPHKAKKFKEFQEVLEMKSRTRYLDTEVVYYTEECLASLVADTLNSL